MQVAREKCGSWTKGHGDLLVLAVVRDGPAHGYALVQEISRRSHGSIELKLGSIYGILHALEEEGFVRSEVAITENGRAKRTYRITAEGLGQYHQLMAEFQAFTQSVRRVAQP
jgi:DNA-binding PadR family transcriptional regulator